MTLDRLSTLELAANPVKEQSRLPEASQLIITLLDLEKSAKKDQVSYSFLDLIGCWNLRFITGTKKTREKASILLGKGKYIPQLVKIQITYSQDESSHSDMGRVENSVRFLMLQLSLSGPVKFVAPRNILAFDFTQLKFKVFNWTIYDGYISNGAIREQEFYQAKIKQQAFFSYFIITKTAIAARGRGGGLALWGKDQSTTALK